MSHPVFISPFAPKQYPTLPAVKGVSLATRRTEMRYKGRTDLLVVLLADGTVPAGVFTKSSMPSAPVDYCRKALTQETPNAKALIVNAGQANAFTGKTGAQACETVGKRTAEYLGCDAREIYQASTGVIGAKFSGDVLAEQTLKTMPDAKEDADYLEAARAIMTTDTFPKLAGASAVIDGVSVQINGIAKGSGMIAPNMGTLLAFIFTDADIAGPVLQSLIAEIGEESFNSITVDGDTSTSDTLMLFATGKAGNAPITDVKDPRLKDFKATLAKLCTELALQIVRDGEGVKKFVTITVEEAESAESARKIGLSIANSPLVKTAIAGEDANWGRIIAAIGKSGERADRDQTSVTIGGATVAKQGEAVPDYDEAPVAAHMKTPYIDIRVAVGVGEKSATVYTTDLTHAYIDINADYRS